MAAWVVDFEIWTLYRSTLALGTVGTRMLTDKSALAIFLADALKLLALLTAL